jgi:DNA-binding NtrC family response regulator
MSKKYPLIFIVEDNKAYSKVVDFHLKHNGYENTMLFTSGENCLNELHLKPDIIIQDYKLQGISGINVLQRVKSVLPFTEFIFLSSQDSIEIAVSSIKYGAFDYIIKDDVALQRLLQKIENIITLQKLRKRYQLLKVAIVSLMILATLLIVGLLYKAKLNAN